MTQQVSGAKNSLHNALILACFALVTTGLTAITWVLTKDQIESEKQLALIRAISEIIPSEQYSNNPYTDCVLITDPLLLGTNKPQQARRLRNAQGEPVAALLSSVAPDGYNGEINLLIGHYIASETASNQLAGVRVTSHNETPGLGDKIESRKSDWILQFASIDTEILTSIKWKVKKDGGKFDAFTGATITPRAVLNAIGKNVTYFKTNQHNIFSASSNCEQSKDDSNE